MSIIDRYNDGILEMYARTHPNINVEKARALICQLTNDKLRNIPCRMVNTVTREDTNTTIIDVMDWVDIREPIITGNGVFFCQHEEKMTPAVRMIEALGAIRGKAKKVMYTYDPSTPEYSNAFTGQNSVKTVSNSDYGGSATIYSPFFVPFIPPATTASTKNITTILICCLEFITGSVDKWSKCSNINELFDAIYIVLNDTEERDFINDNYSVDEVLRWLLTLVDRLSLYEVKVLRLFLTSLQQPDLNKLMFAYNPRLVLIKYVTVNVSNISQYLKTHPINYENITKDNLYESGFGIDVPNEIINDVDIVKKTVLDNCIYPFALNDPEMRVEVMVRSIVCVTDTDSLMVHFAAYLDEFQTRIDNFRDSCILASAVGMRLFVEGIIPKLVSYIAQSCKVKDKYFRDKLMFKNEFATLCMSLFAKKMYTSSTFAQEGVPRNIHKIGVTGLSFKKRDAAEFLEPIMTRLYDKYILTSNKISLEAILDELFTLREHLKTHIKSDPSYYKTLTLKEASAYDQSKVLPQQVRGSVVWNNIMPNEELLPMDRVRVIPLSFDLLQKHQTENYVGEILRLNLIDNQDMKRYPLICLPENYKTIPEWLQDVIDIEYTIDSLLSPVKQLLGLFDVPMIDTRGGVRPSRMIYL